MRDDEPTAPRALSLDLEALEAAVVDMSAPPWAFSTIRNCIDTAQVAGNGDVYDYYSIGVTDEDPEDYRLAWLRDSAGIIALRNSAAANYPNDCISPTVMDIQSCRVDWSDDHPLNKRDTQRSEYERLFAEDDGSAAEIASLRSEVERLRVALLNERAEREREATALRDEVDTWKADHASMKAEAMYWVGRSSDYCAGSDAARAELQRARTVTRAQVLAVADELVSVDTWTLAGDDAVTVLGGILRGLGLTITEGGGHA